MYVLLVVCSVHVADLIESWSPSEKIPPIDIRIVRLQRNMQAGFALK